MGKVVGNMTTIIHCTTSSQIVDVISTEGLTFSPHDVCLNTKKFIENDGLFIVTIDVDKNTWTESESCEGISYANWKKRKLQLTEGLETITKGGYPTMKIEYKQSSCGIWTLSARL
jgi:hypothetical protein